MHFASARDLSTSAKLPSRPSHGRSGAWNPVGTVLILLVVLECCGCGDRSASVDDHVRLIDAPSVVLSTEEDAPLVALVAFETQEATIATIEIDDGSERWSVVEDGPPTTNHSIVLWGLKPDREHKVRAHVATSEGQHSQRSESVTLKTPPLPKDFPPLKTLISEPDQMEPGVTVFAANRWEDGRRIHDYGYIIAVDATGEVVWYFRSKLRISDLRWLSNGRLLFNGAKFFGLYEIDLFGRMRRQWWATGLRAAPNESFIPVPVDSFHHEILELRNGNFLALSTELRTVSDFPVDESEPQGRTEPAAVVGDMVVEFQPDGTVVDRIHLFDLLDSQRIGYGSLSGFWATHYRKDDDTPSRDWAHANSLSYDEDTDEIIVSLRHQDCVIKVDRKSRELRWIFGSPQRWRRPWSEKLLRPRGEMEWPFHQHGVKLTSRGTLMMYDNGNYRALPPDPKRPAAQNASRAVEFRIDEETRSVEQIWEYGPAEEIFYSPFYCDADTLPTTGNVLVTDGGRIETENQIASDDIPADYQWARIFEVTRTKPARKIFEITVDSSPFSSTGWSVYRSERLPPRDVLSKIATTELSP